MTSVLVLLFLFAQGIVVPADSGTVSGALKTAAGTPAIGVRVAAMARPESAEDAAGAAALVSIAESDEAGRFHLESIPPGRYYITAGKVDLPTYYPGTTDMSKGTVVLLTPGATVSGINFVVSGFSELVVNSNWSIPLRVSVEGGGRLPVFAGGKFPALRLTRIPDGARRDVRMNDFSIIPQDAPGSEYRVTVEDLPEGYTLKTMTFGTTDLRTDSLRISLADFVIPSNTILTNNIASAPGLAAPTRTVLSRTGIAVTLVTTPIAPPPAGVRIIGQSGAAGEPRSIYLSGNPGILYSDGTFEFAGVSPGRHIVAAFDSRGQSPPLAAYIVVGNQDVEGIQLSDTPVLPLNAGSPTPPGPSGELAPGSAIPLASLRGQVASDATRQPVASGSVTIFGSGGSRMTYPISNGSFLIPQLLPGSYNIEISTFDHFTLSRIIAVTNADATLDLTLRRAY